MCARADFLTRVLMLFGSSLKPVSNALTVICPVARIAASGVLDGATAVIVVVPGWLAASTWPTLDLSVPTEAMVSSLDDHASSLRRLARDPSLNVPTACRVRPVPPRSVDESGDICSATSCAPTTRLLAPEGPVAAAAVISVVPEPSVVTRPRPPLLVTDAAAGLLDVHVSCAVTSFCD